STKDEKKHVLAKSLVLLEAVISAQVINEVTVNLLKKFNFGEDQVQRFLESSYDRYEIAELTYEIFSNASNLRENYLFSYYDSVIVSAALLSGCTILYSEDMHHELTVEKQLKIINPFI
ncbi:MAG: PIN domain-containing protein, partial [Sulfuricurvum sp.]